MAEENLESLRKKISALDARLVRLLDERMELALRAKRFKTTVADPEREEAVLNAVMRSSQGPMSQEFTQKLYQEIIQESRRLQEQSFRLIGFQGEHGAYGEIAIERLDPQAVAIPCMQFADVFDGVRSGTFDQGVVPVENSLAGSVTIVNDLLISSDLHIIGEILLPVHHCLCVPPDTDYRDIRVVYSHPKALEQCRKFIERRGYEARSSYDTAGAARMLAEQQPKATAAIASRHSADIYGLSVILENIEDHPSNRTRFVVLSRESVAADGDKCSIRFTTPDTAGALFEILRGFAEDGITLTRIESRPANDFPGRAAFLLDFKSPLSDPKIQRRLAQLAKEAPGYKFLGCYREATE